MSHPLPKEGTKFAFVGGDVHLQEFVGCEVIGVIKSVRKHHKHEGDPQCRVVFVHGRDEKVESVHLQYYLSFAMESFK